MALIVLTIYIFTSKESENIIESTVTTNGLVREVFEKKVTPVAEIERMHSITLVKKKIIAEITPLENENIDSISIDNEPSLDSNEAIDIDKESSERILEIEENSGLTNIIEDDTPMETGKVLL